MSPDDDFRLMRLAIALGRRNNGRTWPNPSVGAVLVDPASGRIIGQGATAAGGRPHAERLALAAAGEAARGATLYVSLEPCSHHGRTPPCVDAIVEAGLARIVSAIPDPNPLVGGEGHRRLQATGIVVSVGVGSAEAASAHGGHLTRIRLGRPEVELKLARTADGFAADRDGAARLMISGEGAQSRTHLARAHTDAVLVGIGTVLADDPQLDVRLPGMEARSPLPIVLDSHLRTPLGSRLARRAAERPAWIVCTEAADVTAEARLLQAGFHVLRVAAAPEGRVDLSAALRMLGERGLTRLFCEGGPLLAEGLAAAGLLDRIRLITSVRRLGHAGRAAIGPHLAATLDSDFDLTNSEQVADDLIQLHERRPCSPAS